MCTSVTAVFTSIAERYIWQLCIYVQCFFTVNFVRGHTYKWMLHWLKDLHASGHPSIADKVCMCWLKHVLTMGDFVGLPIGQENVAHWFHNFLPQHLSMQCNTTDPFLNICMVHGTKWLWNITCLAFQTITVHCSCQHTDGSLLTSMLSVWSMIMIPWEPDAQKGVCTKQVIKCWGEKAWVSILSHLRILIGR